MAARSTREAISKGNAKSPKSAIPTSDRLPGAVRTAEGWSIPVASLVEANAWGSAGPVDTSPESAAPDVELVAEVARLQAELAVERTRREAAEQLQAAAEHNADDLRTALRMLEASP